jgi:hypothetical protein
MARVPTPVSQGAQKIGNVQLGEFRTPYMNVNAPVEAFGGGLGDTLVKAGESGMKAIEGLSKIRADEDKKIGAKAEADINFALQKQRQDIKELTGQQRLDAINSAGHPGLGETATGFAKQEIDRIIAQYPDLSDKGKSDLTELGRIKGMEQELEINGLRIEGKALVDKQAMTFKIAGHISEAVTAIGSTVPGLEKRKLDNAMDGIEAAVRDKDVGLAKQSGINDPKQVALMVAAQQSAMLDEYVGSLLAEGREDAAAAILTGYSDVLAGTGVDRKHQAAILGFQEAKASRVDFEALRTESGDNIVKMYDTVYTRYKDDPQKQTQMVDQLKLYVGVKSAQRSEQVRVASEELSRLIGAGVSTNDPRFRAQLSIVVSSSANALVSMLGLPQRAASTAALTQEAEAHMRENGAPASIIAAKRAYDLMASKDPDKLSKIASTPEGRATLRRVLDVGDYNNVLDTVRKHESTVLDYKAGRRTPFKISGLLGSFGFKSSDPYYSKLLVDQELQQAINDVRAKVFDDTGKDATDADITPILVEHVLRLDDYDTGRTSAFMAVTESGPFTLSQAEAAGANINDLPLGTGATNKGALKLYFGVAAGELDAKIDSLKSKNKPITLSNLGAEGLRVNRSKGWLSAYTGYTDAQDAALAQGYSPEVIEYIIDNTEVPLGAVRPSMDTRGFNHVMRDLAKKPGYYEEWLRRFMRNQ